MSAERKLRGLKNRKRVVIKSFSEISSFTNNYQADRDEVEVPVRLENLVALWKEYNEVQAELELLEDDEDVISAYDKERLEIERMYYRVKGTLLTRNRPAEIQALQPRSQDSSHQTHVKLPDVKLPVFSGDYESWMNFHDLFISLVHSSSTLSTIQKFYYLRSSLSGEALKLIQTIPISNEQYQVAWQTLVDHFQNPRRLKRTYVQSLFDFPSIKRETASELHTLIEKFQTNVKVLKQLGEHTEHWDVLLIHILSTRLDNVTRRDWEEYAEANQIVKFDQLIEFLQRRVNVLQTMGKGNVDTQQLSFSKKPAPFRSANSGTVPSSSRSCIVCSGHHILYQCPSFAQMAVSEKEQLVRQKQLCRNCLRRGHMARDCSSESSCRKCQGRHHTQLCMQRSSNNSQPASVAQAGQPIAQPDPPRQPITNEVPQSSNPAAHTGITSCTSQEGRGSKVLLATAVIILVDDVGSEHLVRALLDSGSECCFTTERVSQRMNSRRSRADLPIVGIGQSSTQVRFKFRSTVKSRVSDYTNEIELLVLPKVTVDLPSISVNASSWSLPTGIQLADPAFYESSPIDVVLGAEVFFELFNVAGRISLGDTLPCLINSVFGWVVSGKVDEQKGQRTVACNLATTIDLHRDIERFWAIEEDSSPTYSSQEALCEKHFCETVSRAEDGRYTVQLPLKEEVVSKLGDNRRTAFHRFRMIEARLNRNPQLAEEYKKFMEEYITLGHMERIDEPESMSQPSFFLPHHPVIREESSTTKVRVVFDASCKSATGVSLNDAMLVGPVIQEDLRAIMMRSRVHPVLLIADVAKMYRQIRLNSPLQRIFWRFSPSEPVAVYQLKTVTYGTASAPFLATRVLRKLAEDERDNYPAAAKATCEDFYVDDFYSGADTVEEAVALRQQMDAMFLSAGMKLRKWASNCPEALEGVTDADRALQPSVAFNKDETIKTLGLHWEPRTDQLKYVIRDEQLHIPTTITKRATLSRIAKLFDPLGLVGPVVLVAKIFMQTLWTLKNEDGKPWDWDRELPQSMIDRWNSYRSQLSSLNDLPIDRFISFPNPKSLELHFFSDASQDAYGCCCYIRSVNSSGETKVALLTSRSRVAPLKQQTIPRLELCGALMAAELYTKVRSALRINETAFFWVDSTIVLSWLQGSPSSWTTFVANRVSRIQQSTQDCLWNHVPGTENPADHISRGQSPMDLLHNKQWWEGPEWLKKERDSWPLQTSELPADPEVTKEARKTSIAVPAAAAELSFVENLVSKFSNYNRLLRVTAYCKRIFTNFKVPKEEKALNSPPSTSEIRDAELSLIRLVQQDCFPDEWKALQQQQLVSPKSRILRFSPIIGVDNVIRIGGRLGQSTQSYDSKHPILLPGSHPMTKLLVRCNHERLLHAATQLLLNTIRLRFWILGGRNVIRRVVHECMTCFRAKPKLVEQFMAELPSQRVIASRPFSIVGVDFWGPIYLQPRHRRDAPPKAYVAVFVCFCTKAVHLELVLDLSTVKFMQAFRRFVSRRGLPSEVFSDNGKNFVGAANELRKLLRNNEFKATVQLECSTTGIRWHFNPPRGSHFGGLWEAAIRSAQKHFVRVLGENRLRFDEMETLLTQIECCLNSRPLTKLTDDPEDLQALTPGHFLTGSALQSVPDFNYDSIPSNRLHHWQQVQRVLQDIWKRWHVEYLASLQPRTKWCNPPIEIHKNQLVIIADENQPPMRWVTARVHELHPGKDGVTRVVTLQTANGFLTRPVAKIGILPIPIPSEPEQLSLAEVTTSSTSQTAPQPRLG